MPLRPGKDIPNTNPMSEQRRDMNIGILQTGALPQDMAETWGQYPAHFERLLAGQGFTFSAYNVEAGDIPDDPQACNGWLITGSRHGAYEDHPWIAPLEAFIRAVTEAGKPLVGICFGHQIIAQALGGKVVKFPGGWSVGPQTYGWGEGEVTLHAWHQDQVVSLPEGAEVLASSGFCENAALIYGDRAFTVQAHPEFTSDFVADLAERRGRGVVPDDQIDAALATLDTPIATAYLAQQIGHFLKHRSLS